METFVGSKITFKMYFPRIRHKIIGFPILNLPKDVTVEFRSGLRINCSLILGFGFGLETKLNS